jgi:putative two-component system response regulator
VSNLCSGHGRRRKLKVAEWSIKNWSPKNDGLAGFEAAVLAAGILAEARDNGTVNHLRRVQAYVELLLGKLKDQAGFRESLSDDYLNALLVKSVPAHDIGKVAIPERILMKPGRLSPEEFGIIRTHSRVGYDALEQAGEALGLPEHLFRNARDIALHHHEKWDGTGYPSGLKGAQIPVSARLMAVADVYDALRSRKLYKPPFPHDKSVQVMMQGRGTHFDPEVIDAFKDLFSEFDEVGKRFVDSEDEVLARLGLK